MALQRCHLYIHYFIFLKEQSFFNARGREGEGRGGGGNGEGEGTGRGRGGGGNGEGEVNFEGIIWLSGGTKGESLVAKRQQIYRGIIENSLPIS